MTLSEYRRCLALARRHTRDATEAADLLHEGLLAGVQAGRIDFSRASDRAWLAGTLRNLAAEAARSDVHRRRRETRWAAEQPAELVTAFEDDARDAILGRLTEGSRRVAVLALCGLTPEEIQYALGLKPPAFRQRLTALRRALGELPEPLRREALALAYSQPRRAGASRLDFGLIRRALLHHLRYGEGIGSHDPDGHLLVIRSN